MIKQIIEQISNLLVKIVPALSTKFTGRMVITLSFKDGGLRDLSLMTEQKFDLKQDVTQM